MVTMVTKRDKNGRFLERPAGKRHRRTEWTLAKIRKHLGPHLPDLLDKLRMAAARGDVQALKLALTYLVPASSISQTLVEGAEDLAGLAPDQRVFELNRLVAEGQVPIEVARELAALARQEAEIQAYGTIRDLTKRIRAGEPVDRVLATLKDLKLPDWEAIATPEPELSPALKEALE